MLLKGMEVTLDDLQNGYFLYQRTEGFRFGVDAVLLSDFAAVNRGECVLDMGTGTGIIPILLAAKTKGEHFTGLEIQEESAVIARESVAYNKLSERVEILQGDIKQASEQFGREVFDVVTSNPPYMIAGHGLRNEADALYAARHEVSCTFEDLCREAFGVLKQNGRMYLIHRPFRLVELLLTMTSHKLEPKRIRFVHAHGDKEPSMVLIEARKGGRRGVRIDKPLVIYKENGEYTDEVKEIYGRV